ncbi:MAG: MBL fold metallo-hydrolase [Gammaproteobacteria bacterium]|nr:MBL fold metallo-hydrolase [Gammaproteobacteria bacterium]
METVPVADGVYMLVGAGGNIGLSVGDDGAFVIDDQFAPLSEKIMAAIAAVSDADVKFLVNTHFHGDHVGGNEAFGAAGAVIIAHENVRARMSTDQFREIFDQPIPASPAGALPIVTFSDEITFHWNGDTIRAIHVAPAHTDGDTILYFQNANVIHMGDTFFNGVYPFIDVSSNGDINGIIAAGYRALAIANEDTAIIPGHGPLSDAAGLAAWLEMLKVTRVSMQSLIDQGLSEDEAVAARPTAESDEQYGGGFMNPENYNRLLYQSLISN